MCKRDGDTEDYLMSCPLLRDFLTLFLIIFDRASVFRSIELDHLFAWKGDRVTKITEKFWCLGSF